MMNHLSSTNTIPTRQSIDSTNSSTPSVSSPGDPGDGDNDRRTRSDENAFIGKERLLEQFQLQLKQFKEWNERRDWLAFHHHHYDWWMFPIDEISSRGGTYALPDADINDLRRDEQFIGDLRQGVRLMVRSWGWDIDNAQLLNDRDDKQKWSYWPVRLYKAGKSMWLFHQYDYYDSLKQLADHVKNKEKEKLDYFSHTKPGKANVLEQWELMEKPKSS